MARLNRRKQPLGRNGVRPNNRQWLIMLDGLDLWANSTKALAGFENQAEMRQVYYAHRAALIAEAGPGCRPASFFHFELGRARPINRVVALGLLLEAGVITDSEARLIERGGDQILRPDASPDCGRSCETLDGFKSAFWQPFNPDNRYRMQTMVSVLETAAAFHSWRGRTELGAIFKKRANSARELMEKVLAEEDMS